MKVYGEHHLVSIEIRITAEELETMVGLCINTEAAFEKKPFRVLETEYELAKKLYDHLVRCKHNTQPKDVIGHPTGD